LFSSSESLLDLSEDESALTWCSEPPDFAVALAIIAAAFASALLAFS